MEAQAARVKRHLPAACLRCPPGKRSGLWLATWGGGLYGGLGAAEQRVQAGRGLLSLHEWHHAALSMDVRAPLGSQMHWRGGGGLVYAGRPNTGRPSTASKHTCVWNLGPTAPNYAFTRT